MDRFLAYRAVQFVSRTPLHKFTNACRFYVILATICELAFKVLETLVLSVELRERIAMSLDSFTEGKGKLPYIFLSKLPVDLSLRRIFRQLPFYMTATP